MSDCWVEGATKEIVPRDEFGRGPFPRLGEEGSAELAQFRIVSYPYWNITCTNIGQSAISFRPCHDRP